MHECEECGGMYPSALAAALCGEDDREQDLHARQQIRGKGAKPSRWVTDQRYTDSEPTFIRVD